MMLVLKYERTRAQVAQQPISALSRHTEHRGCRGDFRGMVKMCDKAQGDAVRWFWAKSASSVFTDVLQGLAKLR